MSQLTDRETLPLLAPLSESILTFLLNVYKERYGVTVDVPLAVLEPDVRRYRNAVYTLMAPAVTHGSVRAGWLQQAVAEVFETSLSTSTLAYWRKKNLIRSTTHGHFDATSVAAFLITRLMSRELDEHRMRNLFPPHLPGPEEQEPRYWCWSQVAPSSPLQACPVPFSAELPRWTLCWTDTWGGATWDHAWNPLSSWMPVPGGAISWAGVKREGQVLQWNVPVAALGLWDAEAAALTIPELEKATRIVHTIADLVLIRQALSRFRFPRSGA